MTRNMAKPRDAKLDPNAAARPEQQMLRHEWAVVGAGRVVIEAISRDADDQRDRNGVSGKQA